MPKQLLKDTRTEFNKVLDCRKTPIRPVPHLMPKQRIAFNCDNSTLPYPFHNHTKLTFIQNYEQPYLYPRGLHDNVMTVLLNPLVQMLRGAA